MNGVISPRNLPRLLKALGMSTLVLAVCACASAPGTKSGSPATKIIEFEPGPGPYNFDWDVAGGKYQETDIHIPGQQFKVAGYIQFLTLKSDPKWSPMASIDLVAPNDADSVRLMLFPDAANPDQIRATVYPKRVTSTDSEDLGYIHAGNKLIPFEVRSANAGGFEMFLAGKLLTTVHVTPYVVSRVRIAGSTAHLRFTDIAVTALP